MATERTAQDHLRALQRATAAGDTEAAALIRQRLVEAQEASDRAQYDPSAGMSGLEQGLAGYSRGVHNVGRHVANLVRLMSDEDLAAANQLDAPLMRHGAAQAGSIVGESVVTAPLMAGGAGLAGRAGVGARVLGNPLARGAAEGAAQGLLMADPGERGEGALLGGALGGALPAVAGALGKAAHGLKRTPEAEALLRQGVDLTPGQMNPRGIWNQLEESWQSTPYIGPVIRDARDNAAEGWRQAVLQRGAAPGQTLAAGSADEMLDEAYKGFDAAYDPGKGFPVGAKVMRTAGGGDIPLSQAFDQTGARARFGLTPEGRANTVDWAKQHLAELVNRARQSGQGLQSDDLLEFRSMLRQAKRGLDGSDPAARAQIGMLADLEARVTQALDSQLPPDAMSAIRAADAQYGQYKVVEDAMRRTGDQVAGLTPAKLSAAVKEATPGPIYARGGGGPLRDLAQQGGAAFERVSPPTGARLAAIGLPIAAMAANPAVGVPLAAGTVGLTATKAGRRLAAGLTPAQRLAQAMEEQVRQRVPGMARDVTAEYMQRALVAGLLR